MNVTIDHQQSRFIIENGDGYACLGFEVCYRETQALADRLGLPHLAPAAEQLGTIDQYHHYLQLLQVARDFEQNLGTWYDPRTPNEVACLLEWARLTHTTIRIVYGDVDTGADWLSEFDVIGRVGRDTGILKVPVLLGDDPKHGGPIFDHCILRMFEVSTQRELYCHPLYLAPSLTLAPSREEELPVAVFDGDKLIAKFENATSGTRWIDFMTGARMSL